MANAELLVGIAKNSKGQVVYTEKHQVQTDSAGLNKSISVEYIKPDGTLFATMTSDFSKNKTVPETIFSDLRSGSKVELKISGDMAQFEETQKGKISALKPISLKSSMVASQGFDNFIKLNFEKLSTEEIEFQFGVLEKKDFFSLSGYQAKTDSKAQIAGLTEFRIRASNWAARLFVNELKVVYDSKTKKLKTFSGRSNILDDAGSSQDVTIEYQWTETKTSNN